MKSLNRNIPISLVLVLMYFNGFTQNTTFTTTRSIRASEITLTASRSFGPDQSVNHLTDCSGKTAKETSMNRNSNECLIQADILWSMLHPQEKVPRTELDEAWRNVLMGSEHTWCYMNPTQDDMQDVI